MKLLEPTVGAVAGAIIATLFCWGGLYSFGVLILGGRGSLFDTHPQIANLFFAGWFVSVVVFASIGSWRGYVWRRSRGRQLGKKGEIK
ncbi:hypothetical protein BPA30113_03125 [Burkholderia paludis]|uniref:Uncharacterized protein n=1 Tax=Burkholderia paludis TaxID=1506587 RepID=A0A6P2LR81_9BURK|nr:hypothetical protein LMG30113_04405 [Burkholderia paludis]VWB69519.1 hypothetical protein BPA30113_03125 [Burkholderia paludis]